MAAPKRTIYHGERSPRKRWICRIKGHQCYFTNYGGMFACERCGDTIYGVPK